MKRLRLIIFCIIAIGGVSLHGQTHDYRIFTRADGLAATECASVTCDAFGQIWVGSNTGGIAVYNGKQWRQLVDTAAKSLLGYLMPIHKTAEGDSTLFFFNSDAGKGMILIRDGQIRHYPIKDYPILKEANFPISGFSDGRIWGLNGDGIVFQFDRKSDNFIEIGRIPLDKNRDLWLLDYNTLTKTFLRHIRNDSSYALQTGAIGGKWTTILTADNTLRPTIDAYMASKGQVFTFISTQIQRFDGQHWRDRKSVV